MRFVIKRDELLKALLIAGRAVNSKSSAVPVLANLKLELDEKGLSITGSNYELTIKTSIPYTRNDVEIIRNTKEGATLVNAKIITDMARKIDVDEINFEVVDSTIAVITAGKIKYNLNCIKANEYPDIDLEPNGIQINLTRVEFSSLVSQTAFAASLKEHRKQISISTDLRFSANVPAKMMVEVDHLLENAESVKVALSDKKALFEFESTIVATRLIAGDYPNTKNIVPRITNYELQVNASDFLKAIDRVNILSIDRENVVDLSLSEDVVEISAKSTQVGSASEKLDVFKFTGSNLQISFNSEFVSSAIKALNSEDVTFLFVGEMKPFVIKNPEDESVVQIVTPVRTY